MYIYIYMHACTYGTCETLPAMYTRKLFTYSCMRVHAYACVYVLQIIRMYALEYDAKSCLFTNNQDYVWGMACIYVYDPCMRALLECACFCQSQMVVLCGCLHLSVLQVCTYTQPVQDFQVFKKNTPHKKPICSLPFCAHIIRAIIHTQFL